MLERNPEHNAGHRARPVMQARCTLKQRPARYAASCTPPTLLSQHALLCLPRQGLVGAPLPCSRGAPPPTSHPHQCSTLPPHTNTNSLLALVGLERVLRRPLHPSKVQPIGPAIIVYGIQVAPRHVQPPVALHPAPALQEQARRGEAGGVGRLVGGWVGAQGRCEWGLGHGMVHREQGRPQPRAWEVCDRRVTARALPAAAIQAGQPRTWWGLHTANRKAPTPRAWPAHGLLAPARQCSQHPPLTSGGCGTTWSMCWLDWQGASLNTRSFAAALQASPMAAAARPGPSPG